MKDRKILVTGGAGFIGSHIVDALIQQGASLVLLDNVSTGMRENIHPEALFIEGDLLDHAVVDKALDGVDTVIHLAARVAIRDSLPHFYEDARTNLLGTLQLLKRCEKRKIKKFLFGSSMAVYASSEHPKPLSETDPLEPISPYGIAKLAAEKYIRLLARPLGMEYCCLRYFNVYGTRQTYNRYVGVITIFIENLLRGKPPSIFGDGNQQRDFIHVEDVVHATLLALTADLQAETINVGTGTGTSINQVARLLVEKLMPDIKPVHDDPHPGEIRHSIADISKMKKLLGFQPRLRFPEKIDEVIAWKKGKSST